MPRIRSIKPDFFKSEDVSALPMRARLTWVGLWTHCDDHGRYKDSVRLIKGDLWSLDDVSLRDIEEDLAALEAEQRIVRYEVDGKRYLAVVNWHAHQAINRPSRPKFPAPPVPLGSADPDDLNHCDECSKPGHGPLSDPSVSDQHGEKVPGEVSAGQPAHAQLSEDSVSAHGGLTPGREGKGGEGKGGDVRADVSANAKPPPPKCPRHINDPKPPSCGQCADARRTADDWQAARVAADREVRSTTARQRAQAARDAIDACGLCDHEGRLPSNILCRHDPGLPERSQRGVAAARAALRPREAS